MSHSSGPGKRVGEQPDDSFRDDEEEGDSSDPRDSYEDRVRERVNKNQNLSEEERQEELEEQLPGYEAPEDDDDGGGGSSGGGSTDYPDRDELVSDGGDDPDNDDPQTTQQGTATKVETDRFGNVENREEVKIRNIDSSNQENETFNIPVVDPEASQQIQRRQINAQQTAMQRQEAGRIQNNLIRRQRFTGNRLDRLQRADPQTNIQIGEEETTVAERRNQLRQRNREINTAIEQTREIQDTEIPDAPTVEQTTERRVRHRGKERIIDELTADTGMAMTAPGEEIERFESGTGLELPDLGQQEFAGGTENINADFREERFDLPEQGISEDQRPIDFGAFVGKSTSEGLQNLGIPESDSEFLGTQTGKVGTVVGASAQGLENLDESLINFVERPEKTLERARKGFAEDFGGTDPGDASDADILRGLSASQDAGVTASSIFSGSRRLGALVDTVSLGAGGASTLRGADRFVLRSPLKQVDNPTPDISGVRQADQRLSLQLPVERRQSTTPEIEQITSDNNEIATSTSDSTIEAFRRELSRVSEDDLPDLNDQFRDDSQTGIVTEKRDDISGSGQAPRQIGRRRGEEIGDPEEGLKQDEIEVLTGRDVGFEDVNPERQTDTGGFERQQVDELQGRADRPSDQGLSRFVDEIQDNFGSSKGQLRLTGKSRDTDLRTRDVEVYEPDLNMRRSRDDQTRDIDTIDSRRQSSADDTANPLENDLDVDNDIRAGLGVGLGVGQTQDQTPVSEENTDVVKQQGQEEDITDDLDNVVQDERTRFLAFRNDGADPGSVDGFDSVDRNNDFGRTPDRRRDGDRDLPDLEDEDDFVFNQQQESEEVGAELEDQFASSLTAELLGIEADEDFDPDEFQGTGFDIRPLL